MADRRNIIIDLAVNAAKYLLDNLFWYNESDEEHEEDEFAVYF